MNNKVALILACLTLVATVQAVAAIQTFDCKPGEVQNISPQGMGELQTITVSSGSLIQVDGVQWRDAVTGNVPPVGFPGISSANVTKGLHNLKISLTGYQDFEAQVNICEQGVTEVMVHQVAVGSTTTVPGTNSQVFPTGATKTVPVPSTTKAPGFELIAAITAIASLFLLGKWSSLLANRKPKKEKWKE